jgi:hypothetical protein
MRSATNLGITLLVVFSSRAASQVSITHVSVVDVERGTVQTDRTVVIEDDRIRAITTGAPAGASGTRTIDARGAYMIPGLWYMHVHLGMAGRSALALLVANGVTGVRDMGGKFDLVRSWRDSSRQASLEHELLGFANDRWVLSLDEMTPADRAALYARLVRNHTVLVPTLIAGAGFRRMPDSLAIAKIDGTSAPADPRHRYLDPLLAQHWRRQMAMKKAEGLQPDWAALYKLAAAQLAGADSAGVMILAGTDLGTPLTYPGFAVHDELDLLVRDGGSVRGARCGPRRSAPRNSSIWNVTPAASRRGRSRISCCSTRTRSPTFGPPGGFAPRDPVGPLPGSCGARHTVGQCDALGVWCHLSSRQSLRSTSAGSSLDARCAGTQVAASSANASTTIAIAPSRTSLACALRSDRSSGSEPATPNAPTTAPVSAGFIPSRSTVVKSPRGVAPNADRIASSRVRCTTLCDTTPYSPIAASKSAITPNAATQALAVR